MSAVTKVKHEEATSDDSQYASYVDNGSLSQLDTTEDDLDMDKFIGRLRNNNLKTFGQRMSVNMGRKVSTSTSSSMEDKRNIQRMPTRRPNPKVFNRNALMARENRKKKKEHLETLERDVDELRQENTTLRKLLNKRSSMVTKLRDERLYLKSIIANKTSIMSLLKTIQGNTLPITSSNLNFVTENPIEPASCSSSRTESTSSGYLHDELDDLPVHGASPAHSLDSHCSSGSSSVCHELPLDSWESLLNDDTEFRSDPYYIPRLSDDLDEQLETDEPLGQTLATDTAQPQQSKVSHEHNYSNNNIYAQTGKIASYTERRSASDWSRTTSSTASLAAAAAPGPSASVAADDQPGICLHLSGGRVSLEFCGSCHRHSMDAWDEEM